SAFQQILKYPGRQTCLESSTFGLDIGLSLAANLRLGGEKSKQGPSGGGYLSLGPKLVYSAALPKAHTWDWQKGETSKLPDSLPSLEGPTAPLGGFYVGLELGGRFALESAPGAGR